MIGKYENSLAEIKKNFSGIPEAKKFFKIKINDFQKKHRQFSSLIIAESHSGDRVSILDFLRNELS